MSDSANEHVCGMPFRSNLEKQRESGGVRVDGLTLFTKLPALELNLLASSTTDNRCHTQDSDSLLE